VDNILFAQPHINEALLKIVDKAFGDTLLRLPDSTFAAVVPAMAKHGGRRLVHRGHRPFTQTKSRLDGRRLARPGEFVTQALAFLAN
jgi:hypothetical protein